MTLQRKFVAFMKSCMSSTKIERKKQKDNNNYEYLFNLNYTCTK